MQRLVDGALAVAKESVKTITYESLNNVARLINGVSGLLLAVLPGKAVVLEGIQDWELKPTLRGPRLPRWMENGVSSFNQFVHELSVDSDGSSSDDYSSEEYDSDGSIHPDSPSSHSPRLSRASNSGNHDKHWAHWTGYMFLWILLPAKIMLAIAFRLSRILTLRDSRASLSLDDLQTQNLVPLKKVPSHKDHVVQRTTDKDHVVQRTTDRRRGIIEDLHLAIEIAIEAVFDVAHNAAHCIFSPIEVLRKVVRWLLPPRSSGEDVSIGTEEVSVPTATLGDHDPTPTEQTATFQQSLNTDARTCKDVITELGYPYEAIRVVTSDGYVLIMERIPRPESRKAVFLQHGIMDSSMGWVSNGVVGSPAFAAFDQGYDVFLGNFRGLVSREHVDKSLSSKQYWRYSINEHGTEDIPAMIEMIHTIKTSELKSKNGECLEEKSDDQPYKLCAICHSLGGAAILMYVITRRIEEKPHRLSRLILLSPAGFHEESNLVFTVVEHLFLFFAPLLAPLIPGFYIPTRFFRMLFNKLARDFHNYPALGGLVQTLMSYLVGGDSSNWVGVIGISHYNMDDMPGVSFQVALHLAQMKRSKKFRMYDYGSPAANYEIYGSHEPLDLGEYYSLIDIPVDLVAGKKDKIIRPSMVKKHYDLMKDTNPDATYREFEYAHLDFTFSHREELLAYVMSRLLLVGMSGKQQASQKPVKLKKKIEG